MNFVYALVAKFPLTCTNYYNFKLIEIVNILERVDL